MTKLACLTVLLIGGVASAVEPQAQPRPAQPQPTQPQPAQPQAEPPIAGRQPIGVTIEETSMIAKGWSVKKQLLGKPVYNDKGDKIGSIEDIIIGPDKAAHFAIVGTGGFVGLDRHDVAIPVSQLDTTANKITLPGATKEALKSVPPFQYMK